MGLLSRLRRRPSDDDDPIDPDERSPQLGLRYRDLFVLNAMSEQGWDLEKPREAEYFLYFGTGQDASAAAGSLRDSGFEVAEPPPPADKVAEWVVVATRPDAVLSVDFVRETDDLMRAVADGNNGRYDGWGAST